MDKIAKQTKCFRYSSDDMGDKLNELVEGYNEIIKRLDDIDAAMVGIMEWVNNHIDDKIMERVKKLEKQMLFKT